MPILAGIDEAGYGPTLGPLVITAVAVRVPPGDPEPDLWRALASAVSRGPAAGGDKIQIADSKAVFQRAKRDPLAKLEAGVLAALGAAGPVPRTFTALLSRLTAEGIAPDLARHPWYAGADPALPAAASDLRINGHAAALTEAAARAGVEFADFRSQVVCEAAFNDLVNLTRNKGSAHSTWTLRLIWNLWSRRRGEGLLLCLDKQGGRDRYGDLLMSAFPEAELQVLAEGAESSRYRLTDPGGTMEIRYEVGGEERHLPTALASMVCKYVRELMMEMFNRWWAARVPGLEPTAGYATDAKRFIAAVSSAAAEAGLPDGLWIRCR